MSAYDEEETPFDAYRERVDRPLTRLFMEYGTDRLGWFSAGMVANFVARMASLVAPLVLGTAIDAVFPAPEQAGEFSLPIVPDAWLPVGQLPQFWFSVTAIALAFVVTAIFTWIYGVTANLFAHGVMHTVRVDSFEKMQRLDQTFFDDKQTGEVMAVLNNDTQNLEMFLDNALMNSLRLLVMVAGIAGVLFYLNWQLALITLVAVPLMVGFTLWFMRVAEPRYVRQRSAVARLNTRLENSIAGMELTKTTANESFEVERVRKASKNLFDRTIDVLKLTYLYRPGMELLAGVSFAVTFLVGGLWLTTGTAPGPLSGSLSVGDFVVFLMLTQRIVAPLAEVSNIVDQYENAKASSERIFGLMDIPVAIQDDEAPVALTNPDGRVEYDGVSFAYDDIMADEDHEAETVIDDVSFAADPGEMVALVGPTGAGKSTMLKLLMRLYDVDEGEIRVDGHDLRDVALEDLREATGYVGQETFLFDGTIADNIRYGSQDAPMNEVREAAKAAEAHVFIQELDEGYDTRVGERGVKLSGGQRQRIAIARTVLQDPPILVLDEATSAVDTETELAIQRSIERLTEDRTTLAIAHRLSTIRDADTILVLEDGSVVERGDHEELLDEGGRYAALWNVQAGQIDEPAELSGD
ncbi:ABC-type multidrug transport system, ATPase and permease component [Halovivax ruber XH-70]|uniref:ABC-type multidrug transport system, ATPase and permease component n=1 Tax=Halovivax ruber (strain DSM 18193 / JCM 13892 / XH-70) TaxID=797302 RepID=L0IG85_HALRX|nr:ABC transporter ATP-binding protein [Halovivax ruber]AGB17236.1 ABC-type multidrug transport system, ATPase and permease component [Halovivax ruber XH-70]